MVQDTGFPLYFCGEIQGLSRTLNLHFQGPILDESLQHGQYHGTVLQQYLISVSVITEQF